MWNLKEKMPINFLQNRKRLTDLEKELMVMMAGVGLVKKFETDMYTLLYLKWITNKDLLYSTEIPAQYYVTT